MIAWTTRAVYARASGSAVTTNAASCSAPRSTWGGRPREEFCLAATAPAYSPRPAARTASRWSREPCTPAAMPCLSSTIQRVVTLDTAAAQKMPGVRAIFHRENIGKIFHSTQGQGFEGIVVPAE